MNKIKRFVLPAQIVLLFVVPAIMLTIVVSALAVMLMILVGTGFHEITASGPMMLLSIFMYLGFVVSMGNWMWEER